MIYFMFYILCFTILIAWTYIIYSAIQLFSCKCAQIVVVL